MWAIIYRKRDKSFKHETIHLRYFQTTYLMHIQFKYKFNYAVYMFHNLFFNFT